MRESAALQQQQPQATIQSTATYVSPDTSFVTSSSCELSGPAAVDVGISDFNKTSQVPAELRGSHSDIEQQKSSDII